jgi:hypothetical protein
LSASLICRSSIRSRSASKTTFIEDLLSPVFFFVRGQSELDGIGIQDFKFNATFRALNNLTDLNAVEFELCATLRASNLNACAICHRNGPPVSFRSTHVATDFARDFTP